MAVSIASYAIHNAFTGVTLVSGTKRYLLAACGTGYSGSRYTAITVNGVSMTMLADITYSTNAQFWGLVIPDNWSGTYTVSKSGGNTRFGVIQLTGVDPTSPIVTTGTDGSGSGTDTVASITIQHVTDGRVLSNISLWSDTLEPNATGSYNSVFLPKYPEHTTSYYNSNTSGNVVMSWSFSGVRNAHVAVSLRPYAPPASFSITNIGECSYSSGNGALTPVTFSLTGASVTFTSSTWGNMGAYTSSQTIYMLPGYWTYSWSAVSGYTGSGSGNFTLEDCTPSNSRIIIF